MRRLSNFMVAFAAAMSVGTSAFAAGIFFQTATTTATTICPAPCFQVQMFAVDAVGGTTPIQAVQFDVNVVNSGAGGVVISDVVVANLAVPPATNTNSAAGNTNIEDVNGDIAVVPWELSATVGKSPTADVVLPGGIASKVDALVVVASANPTSVSALSAIRAAGVGCTATATCNIQLAGLNAGRIYLGRFNMSGVTADTTFIYTGATGEGQLVTGIVAPLSALNGDGSFSYIAEGSGGCRLGSGTGCLADRPYPLTPATPEPAAALLLAAALAGLGLVRRSA